MTVLLKISLTPISSPRLASPRRSTHRDDPDSGALLSGPAAGVPIGKQSDSALHEESQPDDLVSDNSSHDDGMGEF